MLRSSLPVLIAFLLVRPAAAQTETGNSPLVDSIVHAAERALHEGRPWRATLTVAPLLESSITRTPGILLLAARAAAGWEGWATVARLLKDEPWLDLLDEAEGRALLARALLERGDPAAAEQARLSILLAVNADRRGARLVTLARAPDRAERYDSAAVAWARAAMNLPHVGEWLWLRAAGAVADSSARRVLYAKIDDPITTSRIPWIEARARERFGDTLGAARLYEQVGSRVSALGLRIAAARDSAARIRLRRQLIERLPQIPRGEIGTAIDLLDRWFSPLPLTDQIVVARRAAAAGLLERAARGFARSGGPGIFTAEDRITYGMVLARLGGHQDAIGQFERVRDRAWLAQARYHRARSLFRTRGNEAGLAALLEVRDSFPRDSIWAATAGWLIADASVDDIADSLALTEFQLVAERYPTTSHGARSAFQAGLITFLRSDYPAAAQQFDAIADRRPGSGEATAGYYWSGRAWELAGDTVRARARWRTLVDSFPQSYYAVPAARRLGEPPWKLAAAPPFGLPDSAVMAGLGRGAVLRSLGLDFESRQEFDRVQRLQGTITDLTGAGRAFLEAGHPSRALRMAQRALDRGAVHDDELLRLLYPLPARDVLETEARLFGLAPSLMAGLIRQESAFDPEARSQADARGLMQVLPSVGAEYARRERLPEWDTVLLYQPDVNMHFGLLHFAEALEACGGSIEAALAAYNAGATPVNRWLTRHGTSDPEVFIERIPYVETRDYVRRVLYNQARYDFLYRSR
jgi:soluble lytic murein transglycosylase